MNVIKVLEEIRRKHRLRMDEKWITINGTHILLNENNVATNGPLKGTKFGRAKSEQNDKAKAKPNVRMSSPKNKKEFNARLKEAIEAEEADANRNIVEVLRSAGEGTQIRMPESWNNDDGKPTVYVKNENGNWEDKTWGGSMPNSEMADYFMSGKEFPEEMPTVTKYAQNENYIPSDAVAFRQSEEGSKGKFGNVGDEAVSNAISEIMTDGMSEAVDRGRADLYSGQAQFFGGYMSGVSYGEDAHDAFRSYNYHGDTLINGMLRGNEPRDQRQSDEWQKEQEQTKEYIEKMTEACKNRPLQKEAVVFRGIQTHAGLLQTLGISVAEGVDIKKLIQDRDFVKSLVGRTFSDPAFVSTSIDKNVPRKIGADKAGSMEIMLPKGTQGTYFGDALPITDEYEYLLQRGSQFMVMSAYTNYDINNEPRLQMRVALIGQEPQDIPELKQYAGAE